MSLMTHLAELERKHQSLEAEIEIELQHPNSDETKVASLKRKKLQIKDTMTKLRLEMNGKTVH